MPCGRVQGDLELYVLGALGPRRRGQVERHLAACERCRAAEAELRAIVGEMRLGARGTQPAPAFPQRLRSAVAAATARERRRRWRRRRWRRRTAMVALVGAAGAVALAALLALPRGEPAAWRSLVERWRFADARATPASPADRVVVWGGTMFVLGGRRAAAVVAIATGSGRVRWQSPLEATGYLAADERRVYCLSVSRPGGLMMVALDGATGEVLWRHVAERPARAVLASRPVPLAGGGVCWSVGREVRMVGAASGRALWRVPMDEGGPASAVVAAGERLYAATPSALHCLARASGREVWTLPLGEGASALAAPLLAAPLVAGGRRAVYVVRNLAAGGAEAIRVDPACRRVLWRRRVAVASHLVGGGGRVFVRCARQVVALDAHTGAAVWRCPASGCGPLSLVGGALYFVDSSGPGRLVALDAAGGAPIRCVNGIRSCDALTRAGETAYLKTNDGVVHAIESSSLTSS